MADTGMTVDAEALIRALHKLAGSVGEHSVRVLNTIAEPRAEQMQQRTPVMSGDLRGTVRPEPAKMLKRGPQVRWTAGGAAALYALRIHEDLSLSHEGMGVYYPSKGVRREYEKRGQARFLASVVEEEAKAMEQEFAAGIAAVLETFKAGQL